MWLPSMPIQKVIVMVPLNTHVEICNHNSLRKHHCPRTRQRTPSPTGRDAAVWAGNHQSSQLGPNTCSTLRMHPRSYLRFSLCSGVMFSTVVRF